MIKILICDDEAIIRQGIRKILENFYGDIEVRECGDGMEGYKTMADVRNWFQQLMSD